jgi:hypothetical protein
MLVFVGPTTCLDSHADIAEFMQSVETHNLSLRSDACDSIHVGMSTSFEVLRYLLYGVII